MRRRSRTCSKRSSKHHSFPHKTDRRETILHEKFLSDFLFELYSSKSRLPALQSLSFISLTDLFATDNRVGPNIVMRGTDDTAILDMAIPRPAHIMEKRPRQIILEMLFSPAGRTTNIHRIPYYSRHIQIIDSRHIRDKISLISQSLLRGHFSITFNLHISLSLRYILACGENGRERNQWND